MTGMLTIRSEQFEAFTSDCSARISERFCSLLWQHQPDLVSPLGPHELREQVGHATRRAVEYGIDELWDQFRFVEHWIRLGNDFDRRDHWVAEILTSPLLEAGRKLDYIDHHVFHVLRDAGRR